MTTVETEAPGEPRPSATVVLLRSGESGPEVLLVLRHARASFGASYVFPGGVNEPVDTRVHERCLPLTDARASARLHLARGGLDYYSAAIRELFEETGILLARRAGGRGGPCLVTDNACDGERAALNRGELAWPDFLANENLVLACDLLRYFAYWVTPRIFSKRYSTRFFVAELPAGQDACHDGNELTDSCWMRPADALAAAKRDHMVVPPPTKATLQALSRHACASDIMAWAQGCEDQGVNCILPAILGSEDQQRIVLPGSPDYPSDHQGQQS